MSTPAEEVDGAAAAEDAVELRGAIAAAASGEIGAWPIPATAKYIAIEIPSRIAACVSGDLMRAKRVS